MAGDALSQSDNHFVDAGGSVSKESQSEREVGDLQLAILEGGHGDLTAEFQLQVVRESLLPNRGDDSATVGRDISSPVVPSPGVLPVTSFREPVHIFYSGRISMNFLLSTFPLHFLT